MCAITAEALLAGPRGRRLCLEFVTQSMYRLSEVDESERWRLSALFNTAQGMDPEPGTPLTIGTGSSVTPLRKGSVAEALTALTDVAFLEITKRSLLGPLFTMAGTARYWQPPEGTDILAATPEIREALIPVAEYLAAATDTSRWADPLLHQGIITPQWNVEWDSQHSSGSSTGADDLILRDWGINVRAGEIRAQRERPVNPTAAWSGIWWSTPPNELNTSTRSFGEFGPIGLYLVEDGFGWEQSVVRPVSVPSSARIYEIREAHDWADLCLRYPLEVTAEKRHDWYRTTDRDGAWVMPDWERVADKYDGVHLTMVGYLSLAGRAIDVDNERASVIAGWAPDATYWLTDLVQIQPDPEFWEAVESDSPFEANYWRPVPAVG